MDSITHFSHEHPLRLLKQNTFEETERCYACEQLLIRETREHLVEVYGCELCKEFFLHKYCAQLPVEIVHRSHEHHSLFLVLKPPGTYIFKNCQCQHCHEYSFRHRFFYYCYVCDFLLATECAFREKGCIISSKKELIFHHPSHKHHPLMVHPRPASFLCDACGVKGKEDLFYHCSPCHLGIHKRCAMLPSTITHHIHSHPLTLSFIGLPSHHRNYFYHCDICEEVLIIYNNEFWLYYCDLCRYFVHVRCMEKKKREIEVDLEGLHIDDLLHLPSSDISFDLIQRFLLGNNSLPSIQQNISIVSHKHSLIYSNDQFIEDDNEDGEGVLCDACIEPILAPPYYRCAECNYFLHQTCAKLPQQLQHPNHPHLLILSSKTRFDDVFKCNWCKRESNGFFYHCSTNCEFNLDLKCAALPTVIKHAYHNHPLFRIYHRDILYSDSCNGCANYLKGGGGFIFDEAAYFGCKACNFHLHIRCVLLPKTAKHRYDSEHPLILRFPPHAYHPKPFDCFQCDDEINPNYWLYHCEECDLSSHVQCFNLGFGERFNSAWRNYNMKFGQKAQIGSHPHPLKFVHKASVSSSRCHNCKGDDIYFTLECETCNFRLCKKCVKKIEL